MSTTKITLTSLPLEIVQHVADCIETVHRPSIFAFSLTSKACHRATAFLLFRKISFTVHDCEGLRRDADGLVEALSRMDSACHVRCISIQGALRLNAKKTDMYDPNTCWLRRCGRGEILVEEEPMDYLRQYVVYDEGVIKESSEEDMAWAPVVSLLQAITHLRDLIYDCQNQFPPSLLRSLRKHHPLCRLHHLTFRFRTLLWGVPYPYEMELATSPSLYRVKVTCAYQDSDGDFDFNLEAMMELAAGLAPNLKEVTILGLYPILRFRQQRWPKSSWQGLPGSTGEAVGSLTTLSLKGFSEVRSCLQNMAKHTSFASLQHLALGESYAIGEPYTYTSGETMEWITRNHSFPCLRRLSICLYRDDQMYERPHYSEYAVSFFLAFKPLEELSINGPLDSQIMAAVLSHHGQTLKKLTLNPFEDIFHIDNGRGRRRDIPLEFTKDLILQIQAQCPVLEELAIPVKRNKSRASEAETYRCFHEMKSLRLLFLTLDCSNWRVCRDSTYSPQFEGEDQRDLDPNDPEPIKRGNVKESFINCAVDEALARSIWKTISQNKRGRPIQRLKLWTKGGDQYGWNRSISSVFRDVLDNLSRSWLVERVPRDDQEDITIRELGQHARLARDASERELKRTIQPEAEKIFRDIWPRKEGSKDWRDDWSSIPLEG